MRKFVNLNSLIDSNEPPICAIDAIQNLRVFAPTVQYRPIIEETLQRTNFKYHRSCSFSSLIRECEPSEGQTLVIFWGSRGSDSKVTISMSASSCSSLQPSAHSCNNQRDKELRCTAQQTDISCRLSPGISSPVNLMELQEQQLLRERLADSLTYSSPASSLLQHNPRSMSILGSVCALLLKKQGSSGKEALSASGSVHSERICRICFGGGSAERLVRPCCCRGTIAAVHRSCLERWLLQAATSYCELCRHHYVVTRSHKFVIVFQYPIGGHGRGRCGSGACRGAGGRWRPTCGAVRRWARRRCWARRGPCTPATLRCRRVQDAGVVLRSLPIFSPRCSSV